MTKLEPDEEKTDLKKDKFMRQMEKRRRAIDAKPSKFEKPEPISRNEYEEGLKKRLEKEIAKKEGLEDEDARFKAMAELDDSSHF